MLFLKAQQTACALECLRADRIAFKKERPMTANCELVWRVLYFTFQDKKSGACFPSLQTIADVTGCCRRTVSTAIKQLRKAGWLRWYRQRRRHVGWRWVQASNRYELTIPRRWRRTVSECKPCARTTGIFIHIAAGHLMRPKKGVPMPVKLEPPPLPVGYGHNRLKPTGDPHIDAKLASMMKLYEEREEAKRADKTDD
jgi:hypothetical protein